MGPRVGLAFRAVVWAEGTRVSPLRGSACRCFGDVLLVASREGQTALGTALPVSVVLRPGAQRLGARLSSCPEDLLPPGGGAFVALWVSAVS